MKMHPSARTLALLVVAIAAAGPVAAVDRDPVVVHTYAQEFINWATPHVATFEFPAPRLYSQVTCNMVIGCPRTPADCDPWDRFGNLTLRAAVDETTTVDYEIARFITPYDITYTGGPTTCSWSIDVTDYQFLLHDSVTLSLYIESWMGDARGWLMTVDFELTPGVPEREAFAIQKLWQSGYLVYGDPGDPAENHLQPVTVGMPATANWAEFRAFSTGHGFLNTDNAAEFSQKWQRVTVDDQSAQHVLWRPDCESNRCRPQLGTWQYDRAGWCPGDKAEAWEVDLSDWVAPGVSSTLGFVLQPYENWCRPSNSLCVDSGSCECANHAYYKFEGQVIFFREPDILADAVGRPVIDVLRLVGNAPNPFNPSTTIRYQLGRADDVAVAIYDAAGTLVHREVRAHDAAGLYAYTWNGRDDHGQALPAGVYLYELTSGEARVAAKMTLLK